MVIDAIKKLLYSDGIEVEGHPTTFTWNKP